MPPTWVELVLIGKTAVGAQKNIPHTCCQLKEMKKRRSNWRFLFFVFFNSGKVIFGSKVAAPVGVGVGGQRPNDWLLPSEFALSRVTRRPQCTEL